MREVLGDAGGKGLRKAPGDEGASGGPEHHRHLAPLLQVPHFSGGSRCLISVQVQGFRQSPVWFLVRFGFKLTTDGVRSVLLFYCSLLIRWIAVPPTLCLRLRDKIVCVHIRELNCATQGDDTAAPNHAECLPQRAQPLENYHTRGALNKALNPTFQPPY